MPTLEQVLQAETFKEDGMPADLRVFYTLQHDGHARIRRQAKLLGLLTARMLEAGLIDDGELDSILLEVVS